MLLLLRVFFSQHKLFIGTILCIVLLLLGNGVWTLLPTLVATKGRFSGLEDEQWLLVIGLGFVGLTLATMFILWAARYWYFFKLYLIVEQKIDQHESATLLWHGTRYLLSHGQGKELVITKLDTVTGKVSKRSIISRDGYFSRTEVVRLTEDGGEEVHKSYLGPRRNLNDASLFKFLFKVLRAARTIETS